MQAHFTLVSVVEGRLEEYSETEIQQHLTAKANPFQDIPYLEGAITLEGSGIDHFEIPDEMGPLVARFCFDVAAALLESNDTAYVYRFFNCGSICVLVRGGDTITILSDDDQEQMPTIRSPIKALLPSLYHCGLRYLALVRDLEAGGRPETSLPLMEEAAERARLALRAHGLIAD